MKKLMLICAPITSRSGYGAHARDLVWSFLQHDKYEIKIIDVRWGDCPRNALDKNDTRDKQLLDCILPMPPQIDRQPDIYVDIRIPNEFETYGKFNIGITAGIETNAVSQKWIEDCNKMDLVIVPSTHSRDGFVKSVYDKIQNLPDGKQEKVGELKLENPMEVLFEGADDDIYKPLNKDELDTNVYTLIENIIPERFAFLFVGQWTKGGLGEDRKDIGTLIKTFYESFANKKKKPALLLKAHGATFSVADKEDILNKIKSIKNHFPSDLDLPNVYLLHGDFTNDEMNSLYNHPKIKCMVSFTHGEGFGRPLLEASMVGLPVMTSGWSGQMDFLSAENSVLLTGKLQNVPPSAVWNDIIIKESQWFNIDTKRAYAALNFIFDNYESIKSKGNVLMRENRDKFKLSDMTQKLDEIMEKYTKDLPSQVQMNLPKLKKANSSKPPKMKLPKLKKVTETV
tara:strand:- start:174 stop:1538 length:1365 start_codon:yes stop_codon:yes gene_type:complete